MEAGCRAGAASSPEGGWMGMATPDLVTLSALIDDAKCFALVRRHRWPEGVRCPACGSGTVVRDGFDETQPHRAPAAVSLQGLRGALRRPHRHGAGRASPAAAGLSGCCASPSWV